MIANPIISLLCHISMENSHNILIQDLPYFVQNNQKKITYISIGCANVRYPNTKPPDKDKQQYPLFLEKLIEKNNFSCRIVLIDPILENFPYIFHNFRVVYQIDPYTNVFTCDNGLVEILLIKHAIQHTHPYYAPQEMEIFGLLNQIIMEQNGILIVQDYSGFNLIPLSEYYYNHLSDSLKKKYSTKILYDITYGINYGCMVDLTNDNNLPIIDIVLGEPIIINPLITEYSEISESFPKLTKTNIKKFLGVKINHFKTYTFPIIRILNILLSDNHNQIIKNQMTEAIFNQAKLNCYREYSNFCDDPNPNNRKILLDKLHNDVIFQFDHLMSFIHCRSNLPLIASLRQKITSLDSQNIYQWYNQLTQLLNTFSSLS